MYGYDLAAIPNYDKDPVYVVNDNQPFFTEDEITNITFENYQPLDSLGRCQAATACLSRDTMPAEGEKRGPIGSVKIYRIH